MTGVELKGFIGSASVAAPRPLSPAVRPCGFDNGVNVVCGLPTDCLPMIIQDDNAGRAVSVSPSGSRGSSFYVNTR